MNYRFSNAEDLVNEFKRRGYTEANSKYTSPFNFIALKIRSRPEKKYDDPNIRKGWTLEKITRRTRQLPIINCVVIVGESILGYVHCDLFTTVIGGLEIPSSVKQGYETTEKEFWLGTRTEYYTSKDGLRFMSVEKIRKKQRTDDNVAGILEEDVHAQMRNLRGTVK